MKKFNNDNNSSDELNSEAENKHIRNAQKSQTPNQALGNSESDKEQNGHREVLEKYLDEKIISGEMIPLKISKSKYVPSFTGISIEIQKKFAAYINIDYLTGSVWFVEKTRKTLKEQLENTGKISPTLAEKREYRLRKINRVDYCVQTLRSWLNELKESGCKLKQKNNVVGSLDRIWISQQTGVYYAELNSPRIRMLLEHAKETIGMESDLHSFIKAVESFSYKRLLEFGTDCRKSELQHLENPEIQINNTRHALFKFLRLLKLDKENIVGSEFGIRYTTAFAEAVAMVDNKNTRKKFACELRRWHEYYATLLKLENFPPDFSGALLFLFETTGTKYEDIFGKQLKRRMKSWARNRSTPSIKNLKDVYKIEEFFKLPYGTLAKRIVFNQPYANRDVLNLNFPSMTQ